jgi:hypothetical protein
MGEQHFDRCIKASGKVAFITNISQERQSGGFSGMSSAMAAGLAPCCTLMDVPPINPIPHLWAHVISKSKHLLGLKGVFFFFSEARLRDIAKETERCLRGIPRDVCFFTVLLPGSIFIPADLTLVGVTARFLSTCRSSTIKRSSVKAI